MKTITIVCLTVCALALLAMTQPAQGERFCGTNLAKFLALTCQYDDKVSLKSMKYRLLLYKFVRYIPDMSKADKQHLVGMFSRKKNKRSTTHMPTWMKQLELADISESESIILKKLIMEEISEAQQQRSPKHHPLMSSRNRRGANIVQQCCHNDCDIDVVRLQYCGALNR